ncbi:unnamed protein product [Urochloa decumbens]|uniref:F-box domain-containing protein n=1 Tax=Urochloa decumbens TaxID=240449 RepID=A0ABC9GBM2_9POAL
MDLLPEELLADILRRLPPWPLAVCRSVSKGLRAAIDDRGILAALAHRIPRSLRGIFVNYVDQESPCFFSRIEHAAPRIDGELSTLGPARPIRPWREVVHHCNGLLLSLEDWRTLYVYNPATRRWAQLPPRPKGFDSAEHLVFDPTVSLHYEVISFAEAPRKPKIPIQPGIKRESCYQGCSEYTISEIKKLPATLRAKYDSEAEREGSVEWPPSSYAAQVFSSRNGQWEERAYIRQGDVSAALIDVWSDPWGLELTYEVSRCNAVCWRGAFYLHCRGGFVMRLSLLEHKYQVIKTPRLDNIFTRPRLDVDEFLREYEDDMDKEACLIQLEREQELLDNMKPSTHLGKSEHGIYYTALLCHQLQVWVLLHEVSESRPILEWELKHKADLRPSFLQHYMREDRENIETTWELDCGEQGSNDQVDYGWDSSDDDSVINVKGEEGVDIGDGHFDIRDGMDFLGYHPRKEIAFLGNRFDGFAYYLGSSKLQYLGSFNPARCRDRQETRESFIYTACMDDLLPDERNTTHGESTCCLFSSTLTHGMH